MMRNRILVMIKRSLINPYIYVMALILMSLAIASVVIPESKASAYIPVAILNLDESDEVISSIGQLCNSNSAFEFYEVSDADELYSDLASGKANTGYIIPNDFLDEALNGRKASKISMVVTPASTLTFVSSEEIFGSLFGSIAFNILDDITNQNSDHLREIYNSYLNSEDFFHIQDVSNLRYEDITYSTKVLIPVYKFAGYFIFMASMIGALAFLQDIDNNLYIRMSFWGKLLMGLIIISAYVLPVTIVSIISFLIAGISFKVLQILMFNIVTILFALLFAEVLVVLLGQGKRSRLFAAVMPVYLLLSFIFGGVLFDLSSFSPVIKAVSMLFIPHYF